MSFVRHTYQFSLRWFTTLFKDALATCPRSNTGACGSPRARQRCLALPAPRRSTLRRDALARASRAGRERLESLTIHFAGMLYTGAAMSLFDQDKRPFAVLMLARYMLVSRGPLPLCA